MIIDGTRDQDFLYTRESTLTVNAGVCFQRSITPLEGADQQRIGGGVCILCYTCATACWGGKEGRITIRAQEDDLPQISAGVG
jgi:formate hydrogenlyase subunit 6/NADH:ubiquinone oxidoreductase subunit I